MSTISFRPLPPGTTNKKQFSRVETNHQSSKGNIKINKPNAIFKKVGYFCKGTMASALPQNFMKVVRYIESSFIIPEDFEVSQAYGVHSGSCYEKRLVAAYTWKQLNLKSGKKFIEMCVECGKEGHLRDECETLLRQ